MTKKITLKIRHETETNCEIIGDIPSEVTISREKFHELCLKHGLHGFGWYFVTHNQIKYFDDKSHIWKYKTI